MIPTPATWAAQPRRVVGLMSGTSLDGVDAAVVEIAGGVPPSRWRVLAAASRLYTPAERARIMDVLGPQVDLTALTTTNVWLGELFAEAALGVIAQAGLTTHDVDAIASHGQTVWHQPPTVGVPGATLQLGEPCVIAERTGLLTVADFRPRDMAAGGHGAPLVPFVDYLLFRDARCSRVLCNIGGMANLTFLPRGCTPAEVLAFDTGPGNVLLDRYLTRVSGGQLTFDVDGQCAARGTIDTPLLDMLLRHPFFQLEPPKSTGRETFGTRYLDALHLPESETAQPAIAATLTALTAESIARAISRFVLPRGSVDEMIISGGGSYNPTLRAMLAARLPEIPVTTLETLGHSGAAKEAVAFAVLGYTTLCGVPANLPTATGAAHPVVLGKIIPGRVDLADEKA